MARAYFLTRPRVLPVRAVAPTGAQLPSRSKHTSNFGVREPRGRHLEGAGNHQPSEGATALPGGPAIITKRSCAPSHRARYPCGCGPFASAVVESGPAARQAVSIALRRTPRRTTAGVSGWPSKRRALGIARKPSRPEPRVTSREVVDFPAGLSAS